MVDQKLLCDITQNLGAVLLGLQFSIKTWKFVIA